MEAAKAAGAEVGRVSRRIFQKIWDPEPTNDRSSNDPVWCLGRPYTHSEKEKARGSSPPPTSSTPPADSTASESDNTTKEALPITAQNDDPQQQQQPQQIPDTPPDSVASSFDSALAYDDSSQDGGWPPAFLDDFESRIWMTYRTGFEPIPRSTDPKATAALSFSMRIKTTFGDQTTAFSSDTGWGCMIRSGQSLLANALQVSRLGRGTLACYWCFLLLLGTPVLTSVLLLPDWRRATEPDAEREILSLFADDPRAPYSLQNFVSHGAVACGKYPGEWFGPSATARCIQ